MLQSNQQCPICQKSCTKSDLTIHLKYCIEQLERSSNGIVDKKSSSDNFLSSSARPGEVSAATNATRESRKTTIQVKKKVPKSKMSFDINDDLDDFQNCENVVNRKRTLENSKAGDLLNGVNEENNERDNNSKQNDNNDGRNMRVGCEGREEEIHDTNNSYQSNLVTGGDVNRSNNTNFDTNSNMNSNLNLNSNEGLTSESQMVGNCINHHHQKHYNNNNHNDKDYSNGSYNDNNQNDNGNYNDNDSNCNNNNKNNSSCSNNNNDTNKNSEFDFQNRRYTNHSLNGRNNGNKLVRNVQHENYALSNVQDSEIVDLDSRSSIKKNKQFSDVSTCACPFIYILFFYITIDNFTFFYNNFLFLINLFF